MSQLNTKQRMSYIENKADQFPSQSAIPGEYSDLLQTELTAEELRRLLVHLKRLLFLPRHDYKINPQLLLQKTVTRKNAIAGFIAKLVFSEGVLLFLFNSMPSFCQNILKEIVHGKSTILDTNMFAAKYGTLPKISVPYIIPDNRYILLLFARIKNRIELFACLKELLQALIPVPEESSLNSLTTLPATILNQRAEMIQLAVHNTEKVAIHDVNTIMELIEQKQIRVSPKTGIITTASAKKVRNHLIMGDYYPADIDTARQQADIKIGSRGLRPFAWAKLIQAAGFAKSTGSKLELTPRGRQYRQQSAPAMLHEIWDRWLKYYQFHELSRVEIIKGQKSKARPLFKSTALRPVIAQAMAFLPIDGWVSIAEFFRIIKLKGLYFDVARDFWPLYVSDPQYGSFGYDENSSIVNTRYIMVFLFEYAATLGLIDIAVIPPFNARQDHQRLWGLDWCSCASRYDGLSYLRLTRLGEWIIKRKKQYQPTETVAESLLKIRHDLAIVLSAAARPLMPAEELFLDRITEKGGTDRWVLSEKKILTFIEQGHSVSAIYEFLRPKVDWINKETAYFLDEIAQCSKQIEYEGRAVLLKCSSQKSARFFASQPKLRDLIEHPNGSFLVIKKSNIKQFQKTVKNLGYALYIPDL